MREELESVKSNSVSSANVSPNNPNQMTQQTDQRFQDIQNQMSAMMNQFTRMSVVQQNPFGGAAEATPVIPNSENEQKLKTKISELEAKNVDLL